MKVIYVYHTGFRMGKGFCDYRKITHNGSKLNIKLENRMLKFKISDEDYAAFQSLNVERFNKDLHFTDINLRLSLRQ